MKIMRVDDHEKLAEFMISEAMEGSNVSAVLFYNDALKLMRELMCYDEIVPMEIDIADWEITEYDKEYYVDINGSTGMELFVTPAYVDGKYLLGDPDIMLVDAEANSRIISEIPAAKCFEVYIGEQEEECCGDCSVDCASDCSEEHGICSECMKNILEQDAEVLEYLHWRLFHM